MNDHDLFLRTARFILGKFTALIRLISRQIRHNEPKVLLLGQEGDKTLLDTIHKQLEGAGLSAERPFILDPNDPDTVIREKLKNAAREVWILVLADPRSDGNISRALNEFANTRQDVPIIVTGLEQAPAGSLAGYTYFKLRERNGHGLIGKIIQAIASRISHFQRLLLNGLIAGFGLAIFALVGGTVFGFRTSQHLARQGMEPVDNFDSAILQTSPGQKANLVRSANGTDNGDALTQFQARGINFRLTDVAFIDALTQVDPEPFALCLEGNDGYIKKRRPRFLGRVGKESSIPDAPEVWEFIEKEAPRLLFPSKGSRACAVVLATLLTKEPIASDMKIEGWGMAFNFYRQTLLVVAEGSKVYLKDKHLFTVTKLSRAPTWRVCAVSKNRPSKDSPKWLQKIKQLSALLR